MALARGAAWLANASGSTHKTASPLATGVSMSSKNSLKNENYLGFFLLIVALMLFATLVKSCNIAGYQAQQSTEVPELHETTQQ